MRERGAEIDDATADGREAAEALARRAAARDADAWRELFERHYHALFLFVRYRIAQTADAEDIVSQAFEVAYDHADRFDYRGVPIEAWLICIARNLVRDHIKKVTRRGFHGELPADYGPATEDESRTVELRQDLGRALQSLTDDQQTVLSLRFLLDRSVTETARTMGRSEDAVKTLQRRALAAMERALATVGYERDTP